MYVSPLLSALAAMGLRVDGGYDTPNVCTTIYCYSEDGAAAGCTSRKTSSKRRDLGVDAGRDLEGEASPSDDTRPGALGQVCDVSSYWQTPGSSTTVENSSLQRDLDGVLVLGGRPQRSRQRRLALARNDTNRLRHQLFKKVNGVCDAVKDVGSNSMFLMKLDVFSISLIYHQQISQKHYIRNPGGYFNVFRCWPQRFYSRFHSCRHR